MDAVRDGLTLEDAASRAGVSVNTVAGWARQGRKDPEGRFGQFAEDLDGARQSAAKVIAGPMGLEELRELVAQRARSGSVPAMRLAFELIRTDAPVGAKPAGSLAALDELAAKRQRRGGGGVS